MSNKPKTGDKYIIEIDGVYGDDNCDCSNHAALGKMIEDAMCGVIIADDSRRWVKEIVHRFHDGNEIHVTVEEV